MIAALAAVLALFPPSVRPLADPEPLGNAGGFSGARLWRFPSGRGLLMARAWPAAGRPREEIERVHGWLGRAERLGFVPVPLAASDGRTLIKEAGTLWEVTPWMPGQADLRTPPPVAKAIAAFSALATFHQATASALASGPSPGLAARSLEIDDLIAGRLGDWRASVTASPPDRRRELALKWLDLAAWIAPKIAPEIRRAAGLSVPIQPVIRDVRPDHFLFTEGVVTGLVDFGAMGPDPVSADLARLGVEWIGTDRTLRAEVLSAYARIRPLDPAETVLIDAFARSAMLLGGGRWVLWHFVDRVEFEDPSAVLKGLERGLEKIERLHREG